MKLQKELAITHGMINEVIMKCVMLQNKIKNSKEPISSELLEEFNNANAKFNIEIPKYRKRLLKINKQLGEMYGIN